MIRPRATGLLILSLIVAGCASTVDPDDPSATPTPSPDDPRVTDSGGEVASLADRPHVHDYWEGATSVTLLDENVAVMIAHNHMFDEPPREQHTHGCDETLASDSQGGSRKFSLPPGVIVLPGTETLDFQVDWTAPGVTGLRLLYRPANLHDPLDAGVLQNGVPFQIQLTPEMADSGHATQTSWVFFLCADGDLPVDLAEGDVHMNLMALRADVLPLEPAHPDRWNGQTEIELVNLTTTTTAVTAANKGDGAWIALPLEPGMVVPPETSRIRAHIELTDTSPTAGTLPIQPILYYRDSTVPEWVYKTANLTDNGLEFEVDHNMVDGVYAAESNWDFWLRISSPNPTETPAGRMSEPRVFEGEVRVHIVAERAPAT